MTMPCKADRDFKKRVEWARQAPPVTERQIKNKRQRKDPGALNQAIPIEYPWDGQWQGRRARRRQRERNPNLLAGNLYNDPW